MEKLESLLITYLSAKPLVTYPETNSHYCSICNRARQKLNREEYELAADEFLRWVHAGGVRLAGLVRRREMERKMFLS